MKIKIKLKFKLRVMEIYTLNNVETIEIEEKNIIINSSETIMIPYNYTFEIRRLK